jgi:hypothetical protein
VVTALLFGVRVLGLIIKEAGRGIRDQWRDRR